ncbi:MAG: tRNA-dihydrouridine synthase 3, partial [Chaenotheca gracillima]
FRSFRGGSTNNNLGLSNTGRSNTIPNGSPASRPFLAVDTFHPPNQEPQTAPLPEDRDRTPVRSNHLSPISPSNGSSDHRGDITPGPSSAPSGLSWLPAMSTRLLSDITSSNLLHNPPAKQPTATAMAPPPLPQSDIKRQEVTMREPDEVPPTPCLWSPRAIEFTANPFGQLDPPPAPSSTTHGSRIGAIAPPPSNIQPSLYPQSREAIMTDAPSSTDYTPPTPGLWSPRATEFTVNPFGSMAPPPRPAAPATSTAAHAPGTHSVSADDPRSPAYRGEAPITRSIFD